MAKAKFETPEFRPYPVIPVIKPGVMKDSRSFVSKPGMQESLGYPGELVDNWQEVAINKLGELLTKYRSLRVYLDTCVKCGSCTDKCHYFIGTNDPKNMPVGRQDLLRQVYRRYFTLAGKLFPKLVGAKDLTRDMLDDWYNYFPMAAREILDAVGYGQKYCNEIIEKVYKIGNNLGLPGPAIRNTLEGLEEDIKDETGVDVRLPLDEEGEFFINPASLGQ